MKMNINNRFNYLKMLLRTYYLKYFHRQRLFILIILISVYLSFYLFNILSQSQKFEPINALSNILTLNGVFSAVLITYLFSKIIWQKDRKLETMNSAINNSQKLTDFRRIISKLIQYYQVWDNDKQTKSLIESAKFRNLDYHEYRRARISTLEFETDALANELYHHPDFSEGKSNLYLALSSIVNNRKSGRPHYDGELYKDFQSNSIYTYSVISRWLESDLFGSIWYWFNEKQHWINFHALRDHKAEILAAAARINSKYKDNDLDNKLIAELADDFNSHYLIELRKDIMHLKEGVKGLNLILLILISLSLIFGVLIPFILLLNDDNNPFIVILVKLITSINAGLLTCFILSFPILIKRELSWS